MVHTILGHVPAPQKDSRRVDAVGREFMPKLALTPRAGDAPEPNLGLHGGDKQAGRVGRQNVPRWLQDVDQ